MAATLLQGLHDLWDSNPDLTLAKLLLFDENLESGREVGSYVVLERLREDETDLDTEGGKFVKATWIFHAWGVGSTQADARANATATADLIRTAFKDVPPIITACRILRTRPAGQRAGLDESRSTPNRLVEQILLDWYLEMAKR